MYQNERAIGSGQQNLAKEQVVGAACDGSNSYSAADPIKTIRTNVQIRANNSFGTALEALKCGRKVTRHGWNGKGMWLELQRPDRNSKMTLPYVFLCYPTEQISPTPGARVPWLASQTDMLAEDWAVLPD